MSLAQAEQRVKTDGQSAEANLYRVALDIRKQSGELIRRRWPKVWRTAAGYALNYLLPWSATRPPQWYGDDLGLPYPPIVPESLNLACLMAGSEGTLGVMKQLKLKLVPRQSQTVLGIITFDSIEQACEATLQTLEYAPRTVELIPANLVQLVQDIPAYARQLEFMHTGQADLLVVEFPASEVNKIHQCATSLGKSDHHSLAGAAKTSMGSTQGGIRYFSIKTGRCQNHCLYRGFIGAGREIGAICR
jgi:hypothetical protein